MFVDATHVTGEAIGGRRMEEEEEERRAEQNGRGSREEGRELRVEGSCGPPQGA